MQTIVFSKNRPAQLDLLLRSIQKRAASLFFNTTVIYKADPAFQETYETCGKEHAWAHFIAQNDFQEQVFSLLDHGNEQFTAFLCDDDLIVRPFLDLPHPGRILRSNGNVFCFSLRLGFNTTNCYPLRKTQKLPTIRMAINDALFWEWKQAEGDFGYPGSLDGHVFHRNWLRLLLAEVEFANPNELEDALSANSMKLSRPFPLMACYANSLITGNPVNLVNNTHQNRYGETNFLSIEELNKRYSQGERLKLEQLEQEQITGAHTELQLVFA